MDRQEAIERIKQNKAAAEYFAQTMGNYGLAENELKDIEAFNMAIEALQDDWVPVSDDTLPEPCAEVQVTCEVRYSDGMKHKYQSIAQWIPKNCEEALGINWDVEATEYNEEKDEYYPLEGWYESIKNWDEFSLVAISDFVVAWKPLPESYKTDMRGEE